MVLAALQSIFCCCRAAQEPEPEIQDEFDETSHLIRHTIETPVIQVDDEYERQRRYHERLAAIVRNTSGRMVNLAARYPFNLHNQDLPESSSRSYSRSATRSASPSRDSNSEYYHPLHRPYHISENYGPRHLNPHQFERSRSRSPNPNPDPNAESNAPDADGQYPLPKVMATRMLRVRLVGYDEAQTTRGRTAERGPQPSGLPLSSGTVAGTSGEGQSGSAGGAEEGEATPRPETRNFELKLRDVGPLTVDWD